MAIAPELRAQILRLYQAERWRIGTIASQLHLHRDTVQRVIAQACVMRPDAALRPSQIEAYLACGVDALFIEALRTPEQMTQACARFASRIPLLANMVEGGKTPIQSADELGRIGFRIVIFPGGTARAVAHTLQRYYASLHIHRTTAPMREDMLDFDQLNEVIGTAALLEEGKKYG